MIKVKKLPHFEPSKIPEFKCKGNKLVHKITNHLYLQVK